MHLLVLTEEFDSAIVGGLGIVATRLAHELSGQGVDVTVISGMSRKIAHYRWDGVHTLRFPSNLLGNSPRRGSWPESIAKRLDQHLSARPDVIHVHSVTMAAIAERLKRRYRAPLVFTCHSLVCEEAPSPQRDRLAAVQRRLIAIADRVVVPSAWQLADLRRHYPVSAAKGIVIPHGVDQPVPLWYEADPDELLYVGRIVQGKGLEQLLAAIPLLSRYHPDLRLTIVGSGPGWYESRLRQLAERLRIRDHLRWTGARAHWLIQWAYQLHAVVIVPSRRESFGLVALEALASGVPLVSTRSGGLADFVSPAVASIIRAPTARSIASAVLSVWRNPALAKARAVRGQAVAARYSWTGAAKRYRDLFALLSRAPRSVAKR